MNKISCKLLIIFLCFNCVLFAAELSRCGEIKPLDQTTRGIIVDPINGDVTYQSLANSLIGDGIVISNLQYTGVDHASGIFTNGESAGLGIDEGIILSCGYAENIIGPNSSSGISENNGMPGDPDLNSLISGYTTNDASVLEFDFVADFNSINFTYVFASDEYLEWVNSSYNDVFGFFLDGQNVAKIPNSTSPVSINNVNHLSHTNYFINNDIHSGPGMGYPPSNTYNTEADGFTTTLSVSAAVTPGTTHHIRLGIADAGDSVLDSWVLIKAGSFSSGVTESGMELTIDEGVFHETDEDTPIEIGASVRGLDNSTFQWVLSNPIFGSAIFVDDRLIDESKTILYTPNPDYNGYDTFVVAVYDNLGGSQYETISVLVVHQNDPPINTALPELSGDFIVGNIIGCSTGVWNDDADNQHVLPGLESTITYSFQWQVADDPVAEWFDIADAYLDELYLSEDLENRSVRCLVTATDDGTGMGDNNSATESSNEVEIAPFTSGENNQTPIITRLISASPNPFNPNTTIRFALHETSAAKIEIYNIRGQKVITLLNNQMPAGYHEVSWNGLNSAGEKCSSGIYFYSLKTSATNELKKMLMLK